MIKELQQRLSTSLILITHDLGIVAQICDKVAVMYAGQIIENGTAEDIFTSKDHHPYTVGLFGSLPSLEQKHDRLHPIKGLMPDPTNLPKGCKFSPRCPQCTARCLEEDPAEVWTGTHMIRCHLFAENAGGTPHV